MHLNNKIAVNFARDEVGARVGYSRNILNGSN